jgi:EAL domain-containing protein (putative c-di-GMP-specific phosphodiesterase class I)
MQPETELGAPYRAEGSARLFERVLTLAQERLGMDIAWLSEFTQGEQQVRAVTGDSAPFGVAEGTATPYEAAYCSRVVAGTLPNAISDARAHEVTRDLPITQELGIGAYAGVPVRLEGGRLYGMLCCISRDATRVGDAEVAFLSILAQLIAEELTRGQAAREDRQARVARVREAIGGSGLRMHFQPIVDLRTGRVVGAEALARFTGGPSNPALWFAEAAELGLREELELAAVRMALDCLDELPPDVYLSVNSSPQTLICNGLFELVAPHGSRVQVEITEHAAIDDYGPVLPAIARLREKGVRIAVDDAGSGYASLNHVLRVEPDCIKLDRALTRDIDGDPARGALARALVEFGRQVGASIVAEGIETQGELDTLVWLGISSGQGFFMARPASLPMPAEIPVSTPNRILGRSQAAALHDLAVAVADSSDAETIGHPVLEALLALTGLESAYVSIHHIDDEVLEHRWVVNASTLSIAEGTVIPWERALSQRLMTLGRQWTSDVPGDLPGSESAELHGIQTFLSLPLTVGRDRRIVGMLCALGRQRRFLGEDVMAQARLLSRLLGDRLEYDERARA